MTLPVDQVKMKLNKIGYQTPFKVVFQKVSGEVREMLCMMEKPDGPPKNPNVIPVMDMEKGGWRSFKLDSVLSIG